MARMTKDELRQDPVMEWIQGTLEYTQKNARWIGIAVAAVVVVVIGAIMIQRSHESAEMKAEELLVAGQSLYLQGNYLAAENRLRELIDAHGGASAAGAGKIYLGDALVAQERFEEALQVYEEATGSVSKAKLQAAAYRGKATVLESLERFSEASQAYEQAAEVETAFQSDDLIGAARSALRASDPGRAKSLLERVQELKAPGSQAKASFYLAQAEAALSH